MAVEVFGLTFFTFTTYLSGYIAALLVATCFATSLFYLSDLAEEFPSYTRQFVRIYSWGVIIVNILLWLLDDFPLTRIALGVAAHASYLSLLPTFPDVQIGIKFCLAIALFIGNNVNWYYYFGDSYYYSTVEAIGFFVSCVWLVPLALFISLSIGNSGLPTSMDEALALGGSTHGHGHGHGDSTVSSRGSSSSRLNLRALFKFFSFSQPKQPLLPTHSPTAADGGDGDGENGGTAVLGRSTGPADANSVAANQLEMAARAQPKDS